MAHGHPGAPEYPIWLVYAEAELVAERLNAEKATGAMLTQMAVAATQHKKAFAALRKLTKSLLGEH